MKKVGVDLDATVYWQEHADSYAANIDSAYHRHRLKVTRSLLPDLVGKAVIDFGCGEGILSAELFLRGAARIIGIDINETLLTLASQRVPAGEFRIGDVSQLAEISSVSVDCILAVNVLAYLSSDEDRKFYTEAARILRCGGTLIVVHANVLFDLFTLNAYTVEFFKDNFGVDPSLLLRHPNRPQRTSVNIRENPFTYHHKIAGYGFREDRQEFLHFHPLPPLLTNDDPGDMQRERPNVPNWSNDKKWRLAFMCSMFGVSATKI